MSRDDPLGAQERPMEFTRAELWHGARVAWMTFVSLMLGALAVGAFVGDVVSGPQPGWGALPQTSLLVVALPAAAAIGGSVAGLVTLLLLPAVALVARRLARIGRLSVHIAVYTALGAAVGLIACVAPALFGELSLHSASWWFVGLTMSICAASVVFGWWRAVRRALGVRGRRP